MTHQDLDILIKYLQKAVVPAADHEAFIRAFERLLALQNKGLVAA
jgi:hypothetical protein